jgi:DNA (cytosine-5)-methyltransferase 1
MNYYNELDPFAAAWLKNLIVAGLIPAGDVDTRSITEVKPYEIRKYTQCHFFAGIGGWSEALRLANWPADRPVWTGSCPCQPFSPAGKQKGRSDKRHLWPVWFNLIRECKPVHVFGEQVAGAIKFGWWCDVESDMQSQGYAVAPIVLDSKIVGGLHERKRLYFVCDSNRCHADRKNKPNRQNKSITQRETAQKIKEGWRRFPELVPRNALERVHSYAEALRLLDGIPGRMGQYRAFGNAIVPQVAAEFIEAFLEVEHAPKPDTNRHP